VQVYVGVTVAEFTGEIVAVMVTVKVSVCVLVKVNVGVAVCVKDMVGEAVKVGVAV
jgi:hypothetical protein